MSVKTKADGGAADALVFEERIPDHEGTTARPLAGRGLDLQALTNRWLLE